MSCGETRELLPVEIAGLLEGEEWTRVGAHLAACAGCRAERERLVTLLARVPAALDAPPGEAWDDVAAALMNELVGEAAAPVGPAPARWRSSDRVRAGQAVLPDHPRLGRYELLELLGEDATGRLHRARDLETGEPALVRALPVAERSPRQVERLRRETALLAELDHPGVLRILGTGVEQGWFWTAQEHVEGEELEAKLLRFGRCTPEEAGAIVLDLAATLVAAHARGVVHGEVKPGSVLVDARGRVKLTDFGARLLPQEQPLTCEGTFVGTPLWTAPEAGRRQLDARADVYSLGLTFYQLLTGVQPLREFPSMEILRARAHERLRSPRVHVPDLPEGYVRVLARMLAKERERRYASCEELMADLVALAKGRLPRADQPGPWEERSGLAPARWRAPRRARPALRAAPPDPLARLGPWELLSELGRGAMGAVFRARHAETGQLAAVRVTPTGGVSQRSLERLRRQGLALTLVQHENVVRILGSGEAEGQHWLALELVEGETLAEKLRRHGRCSAAEAGEIVLGLARGLAAAHAAGILYRELNPTMVLVGDDDGRIKLTDLPAPPVASDELCLTRTGCVVGAPWYLAPEMVRGARDIDARADLYSLGVVFYELVTGVRPHGDASTAAELFHRVVEGKLEPPTRHAPDLPGEHQRVLARLLATDRDQRYASCGELIRDLEALRDGRPPPGAPEAPWWRRWLGL